MSDQSDLAKSILMNAQGELRCGLRVISFFLLFVVFLEGLSLSIGFLVSLFPSLDRLSVASPHMSTVERLGASCLNSLILLASVAIASALCARFLERRSLGSVGYRLHRGWNRDFALGLILGAAALGVTVAICAMAGTVSFTIQTRRVSTLAWSLISLFFLFLFAAAFEEMLARGFAFQAFASAIGPFGAIAITSVGFGLLHLGNPNFNVFAMLNTTVAGVWLGAAYWKTRSLWLATALHTAWNLAMVFVFGLPVSGLAELTSLGWLAGVPHSPHWVSGGVYGPEGGVAATVVLIASTLVIWRSKCLSPSSEMLAALHHGSLDAKPVEVADPE